MKSHEGSAPDGLTLRVRSRLNRLALGDVRCAGVKLIARDRPYFNACAGPGSGPWPIPMRRCAPRRMPTHLGAPARNFRCRGL
jgi:hypothetical protein